MKRTKWNYRALIALLCLCTAALMPACAADEVTFTFHPPDEGISFIETSKSTETESQSYEGESEEHVTVDILKAKIEFRKTATGYTMTETLIADEKTVDGKKAALENYERALLNMPVVTEFDASGKYVGVKGTDALYKKVCASLKDEELAQIKKVMDASWLERMAKEDTMSRITSFLGRTHKPGDSWESVTNTPLFSLKMTPVKNAITLQKLDTVAGRPCAVVKMVTKPETKAANTALKSFMDGIEAFPAEMEAKYSVLTYSTDATQYIDPTLLYLLKGTETETIKYKIDIMDSALIITDKTETTISTEFEK